MTDRIIDAGVQRGLEAMETPDALLVFLTLTHPNLSVPIRVVSDVMNYVVAGDTYIGLPFDFSLLSDDDGPPQTEIRMQNVDRKIGQALLGLTERARVDVTIRSSSDFDLSQDPRAEVSTAVIYAFQGFDLIDVTVTADTISGRVMLRDYSQETWPGIRCTQSRVPGLFR